MRPCILPAILLMALTIIPLQASGFGRFSRPTEVRSYYYTPGVVYYPIAPAPVVYPMPRVSAVPLHPVIHPQPVIHTQPVVPIVAPSVPCAVPRAAPPSTSSEPPMSKPAVSGSTSMRVSEVTHDVLPGPAGMSKEGDR